MHNEENLIHMHLWLHHMSHRKLDLTYLGLLFANHRDLAPPGCKSLQAVGQIPNILLPQNDNHILGPAADGVLCLVQGNVLNGTFGGHTVHLTLVEPPGWLLGGLLYWCKVPCMHIKASQYINTHEDVLA